MYGYTVFYPVTFHPVPEDILWQDGPVPESSHLYAVCRKSISFESPVKIENDCPVLRP